jgi:hypothetical protein
MLDRVRQTIVGSCAVLAAWASSTRARVAPAATVGTVQVTVPLDSRGEPTAERTPVQDMPRVAGTVTETPPTAELPSFVSRIRDG